MCEPEELYLGEDANPWQRLREYANDIDIHEGFLSADEPYGVECNAANNGGVSLSGHQRGNNETLAITLGEAQEIEDEESTWLLRQWLDGAE